MELFANFFQEIWNFILQIPDMIESMMEVIGAWFVIAFTKAKLEMLVFSWGVAKQILIQLNISATIDSLWGSLDSTLLGYLTFFRIPEAFTMILNARLTRYVLTVFGH